jgi:hypothetical protein
MAVRRLLILPALALLLAGCSGEDKAESAPAARDRAGCPSAVKPEWRRLASRVKAPVYCPSWMPSPLDAEIGGQWNSDGALVDRDRSYLVGFLWHEAGSGDVHVNFRGYPGQTGMPRCLERRRPIPCFSDARGTKRIGNKKITIYTVSRDADQWHVTYLWRRSGTLYTVSEHVAPPLTFRRVVANLDRLVRGLELIRPAPGT